MAVLNTLGRFFVDDVGEPSCLRLAFFLTVCQTLALWGWGCFKAGHYIGLGDNELYLFALCLLSKVAQTGLEALPLRRSGHV